MHVNYKLDAQGISNAADGVFLWLSVFLFFAIVSIYKVTVSMTRQTSSDSMQERASDGTKLFVGMMAVFGSFIALAASGDIFRLAMTFPYWGGLILSLILFLAWILARWFFLNSDGIADYTIEASHRSAFDTKWQRQAKGKNLLQKQLIVWLFLDAFAIGWLMHLTNRSASSLLSFLHS